MPLFDFRCDSCDEEFEELLSSSAEVDDVVCPSCGQKQAVRRLLSGFAMPSGGSSGGGSAYSSSGCSSTGPFR